MVILVAGCTSPVSTKVTPAATPTPQIVYVTVFVTPVPADTGESRAPTPVVSEPPLNLDEKMDEAYLEYVNTNKIIEGMTALMTTYAGSYSTSSGYNAGPKNEAARLTILLIDAPQPGSEKMKAFRSAMMDTLSLMDGSTAGFSRYRDAMPLVIKEYNLVLAEMHSLGSTIVDAMHLSGHGDDVRSFNTTETGMKIFAMQHTGDHNFVITLKDENGKYLSLLVNEIGDYTGKKTERLAKGQYYLNVTADGDWTIGITSG